MAKKITHPRERIVSRLKQLMEGYPDQEQTLLFAYALFTYDGLDDLLNSDEISGVEISNYRDLHQKVLSLGFKDIEDLSNKFSHLNGFAGRILDTTLPENDAAGTAQYNRWAKAYKSKVGKGQYEYTSPKGRNHHFRLGDGRDYLGEAVPTERVYIQHQHICKMWKRYKSLKLQNMYDYIGGIGQERNLVVQEIDKPADIVIPQLDAKGVKKAAASIPALEYKQISGFGVDVETAAGKAMTQLASYFLYNATRAAHTHDCIEAAQEEIENANLDSIIRDDPTGWWDKTMTRVRLVEPKDMPMMRLVERFAKLPDLAELDSKAYETDLDIADHAIKVCGGYYELLKAHKDALEKEKERLLTSSRSDLPTEIATAGIPQLITQRLTSLDVTAQHMVQQASNFGSIAQVISTNRSRLGRIAGMPSAVQIPAMDAIRKFNLYQMRRMQLLGKKIDDAIKTQLNVNEDVLAGDIEDASPSTTKRALSSVFEAITRDLESFQRGLAKDSDKQKEIAQQIKDNSITTAIDADTFNPLL